MGVCSGGAGAKSHQLEVHCARQEGTLRSKRKQGYVWRGGGRCAPKCAVRPAGAAAPGQGGSRTYHVYDQPAKSRWSVVSVISRGNPAMLLFVLTRFRKVQLVQLVVSVNQWRCCRGATVHSSRSGHIEVTWRTARTLVAIGACAEARPLQEWLARRGCTLPWCVFMIPFHRRTPSRDIPLVDLMPPRPPPPPPPSPPSSPPSSPCRTARQVWIAINFVSIRPHSLAVHGHATRWTPRVTLTPRSHLRLPETQQLPRAMALGRANKRGKGGGRKSAQEERGHLRRRPIVQSFGITKPRSSNCLPARRVGEDTQR